MIRSITNIFRALLLVALCTFSYGQFGVAKEGNIEPVPVVDVNENADAQEQVLSLTEKDANDIAALIEAAGQDPETIKLIAALKEENKEDIEELQKLPEEEILEGLKVTLDEMKVLDLLFKDPAKALEAMIEENLIPDEHLEQYQKDPSLLEEDTRKALYFRFVSLAVVGGYL